MSAIVPPPRCLLRPESGGGGCYSGYHGGCLLMNSHPGGRRAELSRTADARASSEAGQGCGGLFLAGRPLGQSLAGTAVEWPGLLPHRRILPTFCPPFSRLIRSPRLPRITFEHGPASSLSSARTGWSLAIGACSSLARGHGAPEVQLSGSRWPDCSLA